jgi:hypothetical protein
MKVLPELLKSVEFGGGGPKVLGAILKIGAKLSQEEFNSKLTPVVVRLFGNPDRALRVCLLDNLPVMIDNLPQKIVNDKIFPQIVSYNRPRLGSMLIPRSTDLWLHRCRTRRPRADCQGCFANYQQAQRPCHQRRSAQVPRTYRQR